MDDIDVRIGLMRWLLCNKQEAYRIYTGFARVKTVWYTIYTKSVGGKLTRFSFTAYGGIRKQTYTMIWNPFCGSLFLNNIWDYSYVFPELHADLFSHHASPLDVYVFVAVANRWTCYVRRDLSSIQWKAATKEAEWPKCAALWLVYDLALFFETCMHVYVRTTYDQIYSGKNNN